MRILIHLHRNRDSKKEGMVRIIFLGNVVLPRVIKEPVGKHRSQVK
jgi:hypothetical protein